MKSPTSRIDNLQNRLSKRKNNQAIMTIEEWVAKVIPGELRTKYGLKGQGDTPTR